MKPKPRYSTQDTKDLLAILSGANGPTDYRDLRRAMLGATGLEASPVYLANVVPPTPDYRKGAKGATRTAAEWADFMDANRHWQKAVGEEFRAGYADARAAAGLPLPPDVGNKELYPFEVGHNTLEVSLECMVMAFLSLQRLQEWTYSNLGHYLRMGFDNYYPKIDKGARKYKGYN